MPTLPPSLTSPTTLAQVSAVADAAWTAWGLRRKPRTSGAVLRRALAWGSLSEGMAALNGAAAGYAVSDEVLFEPVDSFRGPVGDVPVRLAPSWTGTPSVITREGKQVMVVGPEYEKLSRSEQEKAYAEGLRSHSPLPAALAIGAGAALTRAALHRGIMGRRETVSKPRAAVLAVGITAAEAGVRSLARQVIARRRQARVARERG